MVEQLRVIKEIKRIYIIAERPVEPIGGANLFIASLHSTAALQKISSLSDADYTLLITHPGKVVFSLFGLERMLRIAGNSQAGLTYSDYKIAGDGYMKAVPLIDYQPGSLRDDFNFGSVLLYSSNAIRQAVEKMSVEYQYAALYDVRLKVSQSYPLVHINEYLYVQEEGMTMSDEEKQFAYVDPKNRSVQLEMEQACTEHLKVTGGFLKQPFKPVTFDADFEYEVSVIIPVRNRIRTIEDAVRSALSQKTSFRYNVIVVDNYSTDGTTKVLQDWEDEKLIHLVPGSKDLGIGGCWNMGVHHPACGKFAVQLDSDDIYSDENT